MSNFKVERTFKEVAAIKNKGEDLTHLLKIYEGDTAGLDTMKTKMEMDGMSWNQSLIQPLIGGETVFVHPDQSGVDPKFVRIIHSNFKAVAIFSKSYFTNDGGGA